MKMKSLHLYRVSIPFKKPFRHAAHERSGTDNLVARVELEDGTAGYGEGLPREYVTGENVEGVILTLKGLDRKLFLKDFRNFEEVVAFLETEILSRKNLPSDRENNTARSVLELGFLDAFGKAFQKSLSEVAESLGGGEKSGGKRCSELRYDGVLSLALPSETFWSALRLRFFGFRRLKLKLDGEVDSSLRTLRWVRRAVGRSMDLRVDANGAWDLERATYLCRELAAFGISAVEQPLRHADLAEMKELKRRSPIPLMLDESLCTVSDAQKAIDEDLCDLFNIRLSKCGGFLNSLKIAGLAREKGLGYQLGCLVGETGILSAAGRQFAAADPGLRYLEGSYDRFLLRDNIVRKDISFGWGGRAKPLTGYGLGVEVDPAKLKRYSTEEIRLYG
jgi:L-Ala-D/L-Glu epimerase / N-acetyl-D-glutamate racemase